jgi:hypothetical protein
MMINNKNKSLKWWITTGGCLVLFGAIVTFTYFKMNFIINGVKITANVEHTDSSPVATIVGKAPNAVYLSLNGREIFIDKDGSFREPIVLLDGLGVITLDAQDKFGKTAEKEFQIVYQNNNQVALVK